jgi:hypothetical protein
MNLKVVLALTAVLLLAGCGGKFIHVRSGEDPRYQDDGVRFRTTYYFRVFDPCGTLQCSPQDQKAGFCRPQTDSLYRFRLTGKAGALAKVHFEAGTLMAHEIEPFGVAVAYDETANRFQFKSRQKSEEETKRRELLAEIRALRVLCTELKDEKEPANKCIAALTHRVAALGPNTPASPQQPTTIEVSARAGISPKGFGAAPGAEVKQDSGQTRSNPACKPGEASRRGFQILGPEGWRTFDQDERLILAMSSSGKPLIATLKEISDRVLHQKSPAGQLQRYVREQSAVERARQTLEAADSDDDLGVLWERLRGEMEPPKP